MKKQIEILSTRLDKKTRIRFIQFMRNHDIQDKSKAVRLCIETSLNAEDDKNKPLTERN